MGIAWINNFTSKWSQLWKKRELQTSFNLQRSKSKWDCCLGREFEEKMQHSLQQRDRGWKKLTDFWSLSLIGFIPILISTADKEMLVGIVTHFAFCHWMRSVWILQGMSRKELAPEKRGQAAGWEMGEEWVWGPCFWLSFLSSFSPDALQLVLRRRFVLFHCGLGYLCWAAQCHFQSFLIAEECHFQWTGFRFYWIFPERFNRIWGDQISICKTSDLVLFTSDLFTAELVACGNSTVPADLSAPSTLPQHILLAGEEGLGPGNAEKLW